MKEKLWVLFLSLLQLRIVKANLFVMHSIEMLPSGVEV